jgi:hypothetical protein
MGRVTSILQWLFFQTILGILGIAAVVYVVARALKRALPKFPNPAFVAVPVIIIGLFVLPTIPRYQFQKKVMSEIEGKEWIRVVNRKNLGSLTEPLTWVNTPLGSITIVMPELPLVGGFREVTMQYEEAPIVSMVEADCTTLTIIYSRQDKKGVFRYTTESPVKMSASQKKWYCEYDWSKETDALYKEAQRRMNETGKRQ